jgi:plasmid maintenance system antidote protein VapI
MWASPPGRTIRTRLDEIGLGVPEFADRLGTPAGVALGLLDGRETITIDLARRLSGILGASAEFWVTRDCQYRDDLVRVETSQWLEEMPVREMARFGWIPPQSGWAARAEACLSFFGVEDLAQWRSAYEPVLAATRMRISAAVPSRPPAVAAWLRQATREAEAVATASWDAAALRDSLGGVKGDVEQGPWHFRAQAAGPARPGRGRAGRPAGAPRMSCQRRRPVPVTRPRDDRRERAVPGR